MAPRRGDLPPQSDDQSRRPRMQQFLLRGLLDCPQGMVLFRQGDGRRTGKYLSQYFRHVPPAATSPASAQAIGFPKTDAAKSNLDHTIRRRPVALTASR